MPPIRPMMIPSTTCVLRNVWPSVTPIFASGHSEVSEIAVADRNDDVTRTIIRIVNAMMRLNPVLPSVLRATSAIDLPPSRMVMNRVVKSWTAPMKMPPRTTHSHAGTKP